MTVWENVSLDGNAHELITSVLSTDMISRLPLCMHIHRLLISGLSALRSTTNTHVKSETSAAVSRLYTSTGHRALFSYAFFYDTTLMNSFEGGQFKYKWCGTYLPCGPLGVEAV